MEIQKIPSLTCKKCGSFRVMMTNDGPECEDCFIYEPEEVGLSAEIEYLEWVNHSLESQGEKL